MNSSGPIDDHDVHEPREPASSRPVTTGRNFAAGMTGGTGYVYDPQGRFPVDCNLRSLKLKSVDDPTDQDQFRRLIEQHRQFTASEAADAVLDTWISSVEQFHKVVPHDYKQRRDD